MDSYDAIAEDALRRDDRAAVLAPNARHYCGEVRGLDVIDLACGAGPSSSEDLCVCRVGGEPSGK